MTEARTQATEPIDSEQTTVRKEKRARLLAAGSDPYPADLVRSHTLLQVREGWGHLEAGEETDDVVQVGGRVVFIRNTGKLAFATLQDGFTLGDNGERLQVMLSLAEVGAEALAAWKSDVDLGDHVWVEGRVISSKRGELSVMAKRWRMASKALRPLPVLHKELSEESRVRRRYVDLIAREEARAMVRKRAAITHAIRDTLYRQGYIEVETPQLQLVHGGAAARPFTTHLNAFDIDMSLRIALGLHLKRTMVGGADRVYEMGRVFRNEGIDSSHSAEFTMLEAYQSWGDQRTIAQLIQDIIVAAADAVGSRQVETDQGTIDLDGQWRWLPFFDGLSEAAGRQVTVRTPLGAPRALADARGVHDQLSSDPQVHRAQSQVIVRTTSGRCPARTSASATTRGSVSHGRPSSRRIRVMLLLTRSSDPSSERHSSSSAAARSSGRGITGGTATGGVSPGSAPLPPSSCFTAS